MSKIKIGTKNLYQWSPIQFQVLMKFPDAFPSSLHCHYHPFSTTSFHTKGLVLLTGKSANISPLWPMSHVLERTTATAAIHKKTANFHAAKTCQPCVSEIGRNWKLFLNSNRGGPQTGSEELQRRHARVPGALSSLSGRIPVITVRQVNCQPDYAKAFDRTISICCNGKRRCLPNLLTAN